MGWTITHSPDRFEAAAGPFLEQRPVENSVPRTICGTLRRRGLDSYGGEPPRFGWWRSDGGGEVAAAFLRTPPYPPFLTRGTPRSSSELAAALVAAMSARRRMRIFIIEISCSLTAVLIVAVSTPDGVIRNTEPEPIAPPSGVVP